MADLREWPEGVSDGLTLPCHDCFAHPLLLDYRVLDRAWEAVVPRSDPAHLSVLCLSCFLARSGSLAAVEEVQVVGDGETLVLRPQRHVEWPDKEANRD